jgi:hypothetical protein
MPARGLDTIAATDEIAGTLSDDFTVRLRTVRVQPRQSDVLGALEPTQRRESRNTQSPGLRFRAPLTEGGVLTVQLHSGRSSPMNRYVTSRLRRSPKLGTQRSAFLQTTLCSF